MGEKKKELIKYVEAKWTKKKYMAWTVRLENESRELISKILKEFHAKDLTKYEFKLLLYLDPYGDTIFNNLQMDDLIADLLLIKDFDPLVDEVLKLALQCKSGRHSYLCFYGD